MAKKKTADDSAADGTEGTDKKKAGKKPAAKKATAKKPPAAKKPRGKKKEEPAAEAEAAADFTGEIETAPELGDIIEAEIIAETPVDTTEETEPVEPAEEAAELSPEEQELSAIYGDDLSAPAMANQEFQDQKTRDEDRPMLPEINAREERRNQWQERREKRKQRREERDRQRQDRREGHPGQGGQHGGQPHAQPHGGGQRDGGQRDGGQRDGGHRDGGQRQQRAQEPRPHHDTQRSVPEAGPQGSMTHGRSFTMPTNGTAPGEVDVLGRVGTPLGDAAASVFAQLRNNQPLPVRQLAAMMRKRSLVNQDPEQLWPQLKAELLGDERSYRTLGLRPRIVYRGRDLFAPGPVATSQTAEAEANVANALSKLAGATHRALASRLARATAAGFERIIHAYLVAAGYREIEWVKRVGGISYASALAPGLARTILISARSGDGPIDRRAVGELRVGVEAKDLVAGILFAPGEVSEDAERELERAGRSIAVICGEQLVAALVQVGVGVVSSAAPLHYLDDQLLDEILAG